MTSVEDRKTSPAAETKPGRSTERPWKVYLEAGLGLKNYWYPAFFSRELEDGAVRAEEICGERIMFKRVDGVVYGVQDRCLHRGVALSARPECLSQNTVTCWFHGFTYDVRDGKLVQIIAQPDSPLIGRLAIPAYTVREEFGLVWVFIGDGEPTPFEDDLPPVLQKALNGSRRRSFFPLVRIKIACDWRLAIENGFDPAHIYGHRTADVITRGLVRMPLAYYPHPSMITTDTTPGRAAAMHCHHDRWQNVWSAQIEDVTVEAPRPTLADGTKSDLLGDAFLHTEEDEDLGDGAVIHLPCLFEATRFPDGRQTHLEWYVPVDEDHHMYIIMCTLPVESDEEEELFFKECQEEFGPLVWSKDPSVIGFNNFDAFGREQIAHGYSQEDFWHKERLFKPDYLLTEWRMFVSKEARGVMKRTDLAPRPPEPEPSEIKYMY